MVAAWKSRITSLSSSVVLWLGSVPTTHWAPSWLEVLEQPLVATFGSVLLGAFGLFFPPLIYFCGFGIILGIHRSRVLDHAPRFRQLAIYLFLAVFIGWVLHWGIVSVELIASRQQESWIGQLASKINPAKSEWTKSPTPVAPLAPPQRVPPPAKKGDEANKRETKPTSGSGYRMEPKANLSLRAEGLKLSSEISRFVDSRRVSSGPDANPLMFSVGNGPSPVTPEYMKETVKLFADKYEDRVVSIRDRFYRVGLIDIWLDSISRNLRGTHGNVDMALSSVSNSLHRLSLLAKDPTPYAGDSDEVLVVKARAEQKKMSDLAETAYQQASRSPISANGVRSLFAYNFQRCCLENVEDMRTEMLKRLDDPSAFDPEELDLFNQQNGFSQMENAPKASVLGTVLTYSKKFDSLIFNFANRPKKKP